MENQGDELARSPRGVGRGVGCALRRPFRALWGLFGAICRYLVMWGVDPRNEVQTQRAHRRLQVLRVEPRRCGGCRHWDQAAGQRALRETNPAFAEAARWLSPAQMQAAKQEEPPAEGGTFPPDRPLETRAAGPRFMAWADFGACAFEGGTCTHKDDSCERWS